MSLVQGEPSSRSKLGSIHLYVFGTHLFEFNLGPFVVHFFSLSFPFSCSLSLFVRAISCVISELLFSNLLIGEDLLRFGTIWELA